VADFAYSGALPVHVVDLSTGQDVPSQIVTLDNMPHLRILASDVPSVGYKVFEIRPDQGPTDFSAGSPSASGNTVENQFYRVVVGNTGAITSWIDKQNGNRQYVQAGQALNYLGAGAGSIAVESAGPVSATLVVTVNVSSPLKHTSRITLLRNVKRLELRNEINQNFDSTHTWNFSFNLTNPDLRHEEVGAVILAKKTSAGGHYATQNARYDWLTLNHFANMTSGNVGVTLSNADCYFMQRGNSTTTELDVTLPNIKVLAGGREPNNNISALLNQGGDAQFLQRFALQSHAAYDQSAAMKFALEHQNPFVTGAVTGGASYPAASDSFLTLSNPNVLLWALKPADDGVPQGIVARVWNLSNEAASCTLTLPGRPLQSAQQISHIETPLAAAPLTNGALSLSLTTQQLKSFALLPANLVVDFDQHTYLPLVLEEALTPDENSAQVPSLWQTLCRLTQRILAVFR
jgi:alpha-mannosidase